MFIVAAVAAAAAAVAAAAASAAAAAAAAAAFYVVTWSDAGKSGPDASQFQNAKVLPPRTVHNEPFNS